MKLKDKIAIVTGAGQGIGKAIVLRLAKEGADIVAVDINNVTVKETANEIIKMGRKCMPFGIDVSKKKLVEDMFSKIISEFGKVDILANVAGISILDKVINIREEDWDRQFDVNIKAYFLCAQQAARYMIKQGQGGKIVNMSSVTGIVAEQDLGAYASTKGAINSFTKVLAAELAEYKINVNAVAPGFVSTPINDYYSEEELRKIDKRIPLVRWADPAEIAAGVFFLVSNESDYITGQILIIDGGRVMDDTIK